MKCPADYPKLADSILNRFHVACGAHGITHFITGGTCLGFYRNRAYIPDDPDIDVAVIFSQKTWNDLPLILHQYGLITDSYDRFENRHYWQDDMLLDITWVEPTGFYAEQDCLLGWPVPSPVEEYLAWKYGDTWQTPMRTGYPFQHEE
jgi:hypothetical protein